MATVTSHRKFRKMRQRRRRQVKADGSDEEVVEASYLLLEARQDTQVMVWIFSGELVRGIGATMHR